MLLTGFPLRVDLKIAGCDGVGHGPTHLYPSYAWILREQYSKFPKCRCFFDCVLCLLLGEQDSQNHPSCSLTESSSELNSKTKR